jgi:hypothetical protein
VHEKVSHTYEAAMWKSGAGDYAYLPIDATGQRVTVAISSLDEKVSQIISRRIKGKYPVLLCQDEIIGIIYTLEQVTAVKIVDINPLLGMKNNDVKTCS